MSGASEQQVQVLSGRAVTHLLTALRNKDTAPTEFAWFADRLFKCVARACGRRRRWMGGSSRTSCAPAASFLTRPHAAPPRAPDRRILVEEAITYLPSRAVEVQTPVPGCTFKGMAVDEAKFCAVSIVRAGASPTGAAATCFGKTFCLRGQRGGGVYVGR